MLTLGIDPGTAILGWGLVEENDDGLKLLSYGCVKTSSKMTASQRLGMLHSELKSIIKKYKPNHLAVEKLFFGANAKTAISVGQARGVVLLVAAEEALPVAEYTPLQVKIAATGYGRADKNQMQQMVKTLLRLTEIPKPDDAADALAVAICHLNSYKVESKA
jgi:crossover junction endodeoxyribonuclease RuvC